MWVGSRDTHALAQVTLKNRVGNFLILFGLIALAVFAATVVAPPEAVDLWAFVAGAALLFVGIRFRCAKGVPLAAAPPPAAAPLPAAAPAPKPKRRGPLATVLKGPGKAKAARLAPAAAPAAKGGKGRKGKGGNAPAGGGGQAGGPGKKKT